jgi:hypothetical protein
VTVVLKVRADGADAVKFTVCQPVTSHGFLLSLHVLLDNVARMGYNHMNFL